CQSSPFSRGTMRTLALVSPARGIRASRSRSRVNSPLATRTLRMPLRRRSPDPCRRDNTGGRESACAPRPWVYKGTRLSSVRGFGIAQISKCRVEFGEAKSITIPQQPGWIHTLALEDKHRLCPQSTTNNDARQPRDRRSMQDARESSCELLL